MKAPNESPDPLLKSLADEAADLPARAATEARRRTAQRKENRQRLALAATVSLLAVATWLTWPSRENRQTTVATHQTVPPKPSAGTASSAGTVKPYPASPVAPQALPEGLSEEQKAFVQAMGEQPLLLVRDASGKVARIHLFER